MNTIRCPICHRPKILTVPCRHCGYHYEPPRTDYELYVVVLLVMLAILVGIASLIRGLYAPGL